MRFIHTYPGGLMSIHRYVLLAIGIALNATSSNAQDKVPAEISNWIQQNQGEYDCEGIDQSVVNLRLDRTRGIDPGFLMEGIRDQDLKRLEFMPDIRELTFQSRRLLTDECISHLTTLKHLRKLNLSKTLISGRSLSLLAQLPLLHDLNMSGCSAVDDAGAASIKHLKRLTHLSLNSGSNGWTAEDSWKRAIQSELSAGQGIPSPNSQLKQYRAGITSLGLKHIGELEELRSLSLVTTNIEDDGLESLTRLPHLVKLNLTGTAITDKGLVHIGRLSKLKSLTLSSTYITDEGLEHLSQLLNLEELSIRNTVVSAEGLRQLHGCLKLQKLDVSGTNMTDTAIEVLQAFPQLQALCLRRTSYECRNGASKG